VTAPLAPLFRFDAFPIFIRQTRHSQRGNVLDGAPLSTPSSFKSHLSPQDFSAALFCCQGAVQRASQNPQATRPTGSTKKTYRSISNRYLR
jgi:hypothetical protein